LTAASNCLSVGPNLPIPSEGKPSKGNADHLCDGGLWGSTSWGSTSVYTVYMGIYLSIFNMDENEFLFF
jgi:hypothetical protein